MIAKNRRKLANNSPNWLTDNLKDWIYLVLIAGEIDPVISKYTWGSFKWYGRQKKGKTDGKQPKGGLFGSCCSGKAFDC